jgi:uncharacterized membrane protein YwaF
MFSPADKSTACGMWSTTYILALVVTLSLVALGLFFSRRMSKRAVRTVLIAAAIFSISTEIIKMLFIGLTYGLTKVEWIPLYFCSCYMYALVMALSKRRKLQEMGLTFLFYGGIVGALAFFAYPSACIPRYPIYHFMCLRTMLYHGSMIYVGVLIVMRGVYTPKAAHFHHFSKMMGTIGLAAYAINLLTGENYMYISEPLDIPVVEIIYDTTGNLYPFLGILVQIFLPFWAMDGIYRLIHRPTKREVSNRVHN